MTNQVNKKVTTTGNSKKDTCSTRQPSRPAPETEVSVISKNANPDVVAPPSAAPKTKASYFVCPYANKVIFYVNKDGVELDMSTLPTAPPKAFATAKRTRKTTARYASANQEVSTAKKNANSDVVVPPRPTPKTERSAATYFVCPYANRIISYVNKDGVELGMTAPPAKKSKNSKNQN